MEKIKIPIEKIIKKIIKKLPKSLPAGFYSTVQETGQVPDYSFCLLVSMSRNSFVHVYAHACECTYTLV